LTLQYTTHNRAFGLVYKSNPKSGNIICRIPISVNLQSAVTAFKHLAVAVRLPFFRVDVMTAAASLGRVSGWNQYNWDACQDRFVSNKHPELIERPIVRPSPLSFATGIGVQGLANIAQVFQRQCRTHTLSFRHQLPTDGVVDVFLKPRLCPREPAQQPTTASAAFGLKRGSDPGVAITSSLQLAAVPSLVGGSCGNVSPSQIDPNHFWCFARWRSIEFNRHLDVVVSTPSLDQSSTGRGLSSKQCQLVVADGQRKPDFLGHQCDANVLVGLPVSEYSDIQANAGWAKLMNLFNCFHVAHHSTNGLANMICLHSSRCLNRVIGQVMQLSCITAVLVLGYFQYLIAGISKPLQSAVNFLTQLYRDLKLAGDRYSLSHVVIILHPHSSWKALYPAPPSSPATTGALVRTWGFQAGRPL